MVAMLLVLWGAGKVAFGSQELPAGFTGFTNVPGMNERAAWLHFERGVRAHLNAPPAGTLTGSRETVLVCYALPNGNTIEQTVGKRARPGDDWHYDIQQIGAQTRFLRAALPDRALVVAYLENSLKSWPAWRKQHGDESIPPVLEAIERCLPGAATEIVLSGHSGGGSLIFGYLNTVERIPRRVARIVFLDSNYAYDTERHAGKLAAWLKESTGHFLCVLAYDDAAALLNGKPFVSAGGGTWGRSQVMHQDLSAQFPFAGVTNGGFRRFSALGGRAQFILKENPDRKIFHTVQVEKNGFIHGMLCGTPAENRGYEYFGARAYERFIASD